MSDIDVSSSVFPAVEAAYPLAMAAYDTAIRRFDAIDARLNTLASFAVSISLAVPVLASTKGLSFHSFWFGLAAVAFVAGIAVVTFARVHGTLTLFDPKTTYESYLDLSEWEYKRHQIYWAGENFQHNRILINRNGKLAAIGAALFALEAVSVAAWVVTVVP